MLMVSLLAVLMVGFVGSMRWEIFSARTHLGGVRASFFAQAGVDLALTRMTNELSDTTRFWVSQPGRIMMSPKGTVQPANVYVDLSSGAAPLSATADQAADLNIRQQEDSSRYLLAPDNLPLKVKWIYVRKDGTYDTAVPSGAPGANPVVGRFAFWVDDESCKVNINTAWTRDSSVNSKPVSHASRISLSEVTPLTALDASQISAMRTASHFFNSPTEVALAGGNAVYLARTNAFSVTHYNHTPELNMFGEERIMLTTRQALAGAGNTNFINILKNPSSNDDPGIEANLNTASVSALVNRLYKQMTRKDWPIAPGKSFADKYAPGHPDVIYQHILNIIEYVRAVESSQALVEPLHGYWNGTQFLYNPIGKSGVISKCIGITRYPYIMEVSVFAPATKAPNPLNTAKNSFNNKYYMKVFMPNQRGLVSGGLPVDLTKLCVAVAVNRGYDQDLSGYLSADTAVTTTGTLTSVLGGDVMLYPGESKVISFIVPDPDYGGTQRGSKFSVLYSLALPINAAYPSRGVRLQRVPAVGGFNFTVDSTLIPEAAVHTYSVSDPMVNGPHAVWHTSPPETGSNQLYTQPTFTSLGSPNSALSPQQDTDASGMLTSYSSLILPAPKGLGSNTLGQVLSVGELGYVHTGVVACTYSGVDAAPFRTLRLQPRKDNSTLPDWALLDLFCAPPLAIDLVDKPYQQPNNFSGGKININGMILPFTKADGKTPQVSRLQPVTALLSGATTFSSTVSKAQAAVLSSNIVNRVLATGNLTTGVEYATNVYFAPGQMAEIKGVADGGEQSERLVSDAMALATTRGGVFSIYAVGQALLQDKTGKISVQGERRSQVMVERLTSGSTVKFVPVYSRDMKP